MPPQPGRPALAALAALAAGRPWGMRMPDFKQDLPSL